MTVNVQEIPHNTAGNFQSLEKSGATTSNDWEKSPERSR